MCYSQTEISERASNIRAFKCIVDTTKKPLGKARSLVTEKIL